MFIDSHAHFNMCIDEGFSEDELLHEMETNNIGYAVQISTEADNFTWSRDFSRKYPHIYFSLGIHPSSEHIEEDLGTMEDLVDEAVSGGERLFGIGETGLDYHWMTRPKEEQMALFSAQVEIAQKYALPVIVHNRDAFDDTYYILQSMNYQNIIIHCFSGTKEDAKRFLDMGCFISFAGNLTFKKAHELQEACRYVPADRLLLETDCPFLTPVPHRGKKNRPDYVRYTYQYAADLRNEEVHVLQDIIADNFNKLTTVK